jgi:hypothetical protein
MVPTDVVLIIQEEQFQVFVKCAWFCFFVQNMVALNCKLLKTKQFQISFTFETVFLDASVYQYAAVNRT